MIGEDTSHSVSPAMQSAAFESAGLPYRYVAIDVPSGEVCSALSLLRDRGYIGVNVTVPHKREAMGWLNEFDPGDTPELDVVNAISLPLKKGFNTDTIGFEESLRPFNLSSGDHILVLGAGGSARAVLAVLARRDYRILLWNRTKERALELAGAYPGIIDVVDHPDPIDCRLIVNCTSASKHGEDLPVHWTRAPKHAIAYDLFYAPYPLAFLEGAKRHGLRIVDGVPMVVAQGAAAWPKWGIRECAPKEVMEHAARKALKAHSRGH